MQSLGVLLQSRGEEGEPLPLPIQSLDRAGAKFRRGQLSLVASAPGGCKTMLATFMALNAMYDEFTGVPTLYVSADSDMHTISTRILTSVSRVSQEEAEELLGKSDLGTLQTIEQASDHIWWNFAPSPTLEDIDNEVKAYGYAMGEYPHLIVVDNLMDINEPGEEYSRYREIIMFLIELARSTGAHVMLLHHVIGSYTNGDKPIPRDGIRQKVDEKPVLILTLYNVDETTLGICIVKNRGRQASATGGYQVMVPILKDRAWIGG